LFRNYFSLVLLVQVGCFLISSCIGVCSLHTLYNIYNIGEEGHMKEKNPRREARQGQGDLSTPTNQGQSSGHSAAAKTLNPKL
jgi:hypothetical protein